MVSISGYIALICFTLPFYLASRIPIFNYLFNGLQRQLKWHHYIGMISFVAMLCHLGLLLWRFHDNISLLFNWSDVAISSGWLAFMLVIAIMPFAFFRTQIPYRQWRLIHLVTVICLICAMLHILLMLDPYTLAEWMFFLMLAAFSMVALLISVILPGTSFWGNRYKIINISEPHPKLFLLKLTPCKDGLLPNYKAGHFLYLKFLSDNFSHIWHPFTIISTPSEPFIELFVKARGRDTYEINNSSLFASVRILAPFGDPFWKSDQAQLWISYGVGAAIFLAAVRSFPKSFKKKIHFICCDSSQDKIFYKDELDACMQQNINFSWESYIGSGQQFVAKFDVQKLTINNFKMIRICGHPGFQGKLKSILKSYGIKSHNIRLEGLL